MIRRLPNRGDVISILNRSVQEGVITSFQTRLFDKGLSGNEPDIAITVADPDGAGEALRQVRDALAPLGMDLTVVLDVRSQD